MSKSQKTKNDPPFRKESLVLTENDWGPNLNVDGLPDKNGHHVRLTLLQFPDRSGYRVCIWGGDDTGMELDFENEKFALAVELYDLLSGCGSVNQNDLRFLGMVTA